MFFIWLLFILSINNIKTDHQEIIHIRIDEELPLWTILFTTPNNITYRLFDSGRNQNSFVYYNTTTGHILLSKSLDREYLCSKHICSCTECQFIIELIEWQIPYRLFKLILIINDINDHRPIFSSDNYHINLIENVPIGFKLPIESAYDADLGENSRIHYELRNYNKGPFELVTEMNGELALKVMEEIDREKRDFYQYELIASDHGKPRKQSSTQLNIRVSDMNDNSVLLSKTYIQLRVSENTPVGTKLTHINATDKDLGLNGQIHYSISNGFPSSSWRDYFRIGDLNGILTLVNSLDYESEQSYRLIVQVRDLGENSIARFVIIDISIIDENDNYPQAFVTFVNPLINDSIVSIVENTPIGDVLAHISLYDQDSGLNGKLSYKIEQGEDLIGIKLLDQESLLLIVNRLIDREDKSIKSNKFILNISDHGKPSKSIRLEYQLDIIDSNDSPPKFNSSIDCNLHINYSKNRSIDQPLFQIQAIDLDLGNNGLISYSILPPYDHLFVINNHGEVFYFDYLNESFYYLQIMAIDHGKPIQLNSTYNCSLLIYKIYDLEKLNQSITLNAYRDKFQLNFFYLFVMIFIIVILILIVFGFYKYIFNHERYFQENKTYHLYVSIPRKLSYIYNESISTSSQISDNQSDEHERFVHLNSDQSFNQNLLSNDHQISQTVRNTSPSSISSIIISKESSNNFWSQSKQNNRSVSLSNSTATTCTNTEIDSSRKLNNSNSTIVRLAEEENVDI